MTEATPIPTPGESDESLRHERAVFRRLADGLLSADEFRQVEERLATERAYRERYVGAMQIEAALYEAANEPGFENAPPPTPLREERTFRRWWIAAAATSVAGVALAAWLLNTAPTRFQMAQLQGLQDAAVVVHGDAGTLSRPGFQVGARLKPGVLILGDGELELEFLSGARVVMEGPCELHLLSEKAATLIRGRAAARVQNAARGFVLNAPDAAIVDLGTEFAVGVDQAGRSEVQVTDGEVEVNVLGDDGSTLSSERLLESHAVRVSPSTAGLETVENRRTDLPSITTRPRPPLNITPDYVQAVLAKDPILYWRFSELSQGLVKNEREGRWAGRLQTGADPGSIQIADGVASFKAHTTPRFLATDLPLIDLNAGEFTIELWANPDRLHNATLMGIAPDQEGGEETKLNVLELAHQTNYVHTPGTFRFLHRDPPSRRGGINLFAQEGCTPGQWHHLVAVKTPTQLRFYVNGRCVRTFDEQVGRDQRNYRIVVGQLRRGTIERQFVGAMDEIAIYRSALTEQEVARHFQLGTD